MNLNEVVEDRSFEYKYLYSRILPFVKPYLFRGILGLLIAIPAGSIDSLMPMALKFFMDDVLGHHNKFFAMMIPFAIVMFAVVQGLLRYSSNYMNDWTGRRITNDIKKFLYKKLAFSDSAFFNTNSSGLILNRFSSDADSASAGLINNLKEIITQICSAIGFAVVLLYNSWQLALIAIFVLGFTFVPVVLLRKRLKFISNEGMRVSSRILTFFNETIGGNKIVASYNMQNNQIQNFNVNVKDAFDLSMKYTKSVGWLSPIMYLIASFGVALVFGFGTYLFFTGKVSQGNLAAFVAALLLLYKPIKSLGGNFAEMQTAFVAMDRIVDLFDYEPEIQDNKNAVKIDGVKNSISFENVFFEYENDKPILKNINLNVKIGESVALVGNSGGGKSTFVNLIPRFYDINSGNVRLDGLDIREIEVYSLRQNIAVVFQDNFLFSGTIKDNILIGKPDATDEEIAKAINDAYLSEFVSELEDGVNTQIGERGTRLSGGQKQRLAIARALIKNAPIVILDEATSALDNKSEAVVQKAIEKLMQNRTVFVIAHRLSTIKNVDRIVVINDGEIAETGSHDELLKNDSGIYKNLYNMQFKVQAEPVSN